MAYDIGEYGYPLKPANPGKHALQAAGEAMDAETAHSQWHKDHPGETCGDMFPSNTYEDSMRWEQMLGFGGGGTVMPGDALLCDEPDEIDD